MINDTHTDLKKVEIQTRPIDLSMIPDHLRTRFFNPGELETLIALIKSCNAKTVVEIGCQNGRTAKAVLGNVETVEKYIGIDVPPDYVTECQVQRSEVPKQAGQYALDDDRFTLLLNKTGSRGVEHVLPKADVVFIDGDHSKDGVIHDHNMALRIINSGGLIVHHDYHDLGTVGVKEAIRELSKEHTFLYVRKTWMVIQKIND